MRLIKKPIYKRPWFIVVAFFLLYGALVGGGESKKPTTEPIATLASVPATESITETLTTEPATEAKTEPATEAKTEPVTEPETEPATEPETERKQKQEQITKTYDIYDAPYIGNRNSYKFHHSYCGSVKKMKNSNKVPLASRDDAIDRGFVPCKRCNP